MNKHFQVHLIDEQIKELDSLTRSGNAPARTQTRARILLLTDRSGGQERTDQDVADALLCHKGTVANVRYRFRDGGLNRALYDQPRPGQTPKITGEIEAQLTVLACSEPPTGCARWTLRLLAGRMIELGYVEYVSHVTVGDVLKKTHSSPGGSNPGALPSHQHSM
jgi:putative transposase